MKSQIIRSLSVLSAAAIVAGAAAGNPAVAKSGSSDDKTTFFLLSTGADPDATAKVTLELKSGRDKMRVELRELPVGAYNLLVAGAVEATINVKPDNSGSGETKGEIRFDSKKGNPLTFNPLGQTIAIEQGATTYFSDTFVSNPGSIPDSEVQLDLLSTGVIGGAEGEAEYKLRNGRTDFSVEIEDVPAGSYDLRVNGVPVATINAAPRPGKGSIQGEVEFSSDTHEVGHLPLTFNPLGALIEVFQGSTLILTLNFPATI